MYRSSMTGSILTIDRVLEREEKKDISLGKVNCVEINNEVMDERHRAKTDCLSDCIYEKRLQNHLTDVVCDLVEIQGSTIEVQEQKDHIYVVQEGWLQLQKGDETAEVQQGSVITIPKGEKITFNVPAYVKLLKLKSF